MTEQKYLYIPVEVKVRELYGKLMLAAAAASRDYKVVIARKAELMEMLPELPPGIFLASWAQENFLGLFEKLKGLGFVTAVMDEEGLVIFSEDVYRRTKLSDKVLSLTDIMFGWGAKQIDTVKTLCSPGKFPDFYPSGNVRFDVLKPEMQSLSAVDVQSIKERFGRVILINSSFSLGNCYGSCDERFENLKKKKVIKTQDEWDHYHKYRVLQEKLVKAYVEAIPDIAAKFPDHTIIVRPHPSEDHQTWIDGVPDLNNVKVLHEGPVHNWLYASDVIIHHYCTTAMEAYAAGTKAVAYRPFRDDDVETPFPYSASLEAEDKASLLAMLDHVINGDATDLTSKRAANDELLKYHLGNVGEQYAYRMMLEAFEGHAVDAGRDLSCAFKTKRRFLDFARCVKRSLFGGGSAYLDQKCGSLEKDELQSLIDEMARLRPDIDRVTVKPISKMCFVVGKS
jgi:surface carbohydrate biosynthesis protein